MGLNTVYLGVNINKCQYRNMVTGLCCNLLIHCGIEVDNHAPSYGSFKLVLVKSLLY